MLGRIASLLKVKPPAGDVTGLLRAHGKTVPSDGEAGYETGCIFAHTDGAAGGTLYVNEGDVDDCDFNAVEAVGNTIAAKTITALTSTTASIATADTASLYAESVVQSQGNPTDLVDTAVTLTIAQLLTKIIVATPTDNRSQALPAGALMDAGKPIAIGEAFDWSLVNLASATHAETITAGVGHTIVGNAVVAAASSGTFRSRRTAANTWITYRIA